MTSSDAYIKRHALLLRIVQSIDALRVNAAL